MGDFKRLLVCRKAYALGLNMHRIMAVVRGRTHVGLRGQLARAAGSIATNIVEGHGQTTKRNFARYVCVSINSANETENHLLTARDLGVVSRAEYLAIMTQLVEVRRMLYGLRTSLLREE